MLVLHRRYVCLAVAAVMSVLVPTPLRAQQAVTYDIVSSFTMSFEGGKAPSSLVQGLDGSFYGTTLAGGTFDAGVLFRMDTTGAIAVLHHFSGNADGGQPYVLVRASNGRIVGATRTGVAGTTTLFSVTPDGVFTTLHTFSAAESPAIDLFAASDGNVYGLLGRGGDFGNGSVVVIDPGGTVATLHQIPTSAGTSPNSLIKASDGRFYLTATLGGAFGGGTVFTVDGAGTATILYSFPASPLRARSPHGLIQGTDGRLYGTTDGTVYALDLAGNYELLHTIQDDDRAPALDLVHATDGNLYGVRNRSTSSTFFRLTLSGTVTTVGSILSLAGQLIQGADGRLYNTTDEGGRDGGGTIIALGLAGGITTLYEFTIGAGVGGPGRPNGVIQTSDGRFYGTTVIQNPEDGRLGTVFAMDAAGVRTTLQSFVLVFGIGPPVLPQGTPVGRLFEGVDGSVYGATYTFGDPIIPAGQIYKIDPANQYTRIALVNGIRGGAIQARDGRVYFSASDPGAPVVGRVFRVEANGAITTLRTFGTDSAYPLSELVEVDDGSLYGVTEGGSVYSQIVVIANPAATIFQLDPVTLAFATRYTFPDRVKPAGGLTLGADGLLYGATVNGGAAGVGTVFSLDAAGTFTTLHEFATTDGAMPSAGVIQGSDGRLYGTTRSGGAFGNGTLFVLNVTGGLTTLHHFSLSDGATPVGKLFQANDGTFYGAASAGGPQGGGVIFRVSLTASPSDEYFEIVSRNSGKCLDVAAGSTDPGAAVLQWSCHGGPNQQWRLEPAGGGAVRIISRHSGQALDVAGGSIDDGAPILQWPVHGGDNQAWTLAPASNGYVQLVVRHSGKAMDVEFGSSSDGARVLQWSPHNGPNQQWLLRPIATPALTSSR